MRILYTILLLILGIPTFSQGNFVIHRFTCQRALEGSAEKYMITELVQLDPNARISLDGERVKVGVRPGVDGNAVMGALQRSGVCDPVVGRSETDGASESGYPVYHPTGDPAVDDATYDAAKRAWIASDPKGYEILQTPPNDDE